MGAKDGYGVYHWVIKFILILLNSSIIFINKIIFKYNLIFNDF